MNKRSVACVSLLEWVHSIERLHGIERIEPEIIVTPLEEEILKKKKKKRKKMNYQKTWNIDLAICLSPLRL